MKTLFILLLALVLSLFIVQNSFINEQKKFERVRKAYADKGTLISQTLKEHEINENDLNILIVAYKEEQELELYAKNKSEQNYKKIKTYTICASSGDLGPKRKMGDAQVPEGFYHIDRFNPSSNYYLSLGINYPNQSDVKKSMAANLGGDIFIHGSCVTIGCLPMTDDKIKEIYLYAIEAKQAGQSKIPVYIFPYKMTDENMEDFSQVYKTNQALIKFWANLKKGYEAFQKDKKALNVNIDPSGNYFF